MAMEVLGNHDLAEMVVRHLLHVESSRHPRVIHNRVMSLFVAVHGRAVLHSTDCLHMMHAIARSQLADADVAVASSVLSFPEVVCKWYTGVYRMHIRSEWKRVVLTMVDTYHKCDFLQNVPYHSIRRMERRGLSPFHSHRIRKAKRMRWTETVFTEHHLRRCSIWVERLQDPSFSLETFFDSGGFAEQISFQFLSTVIDREPWQVPTVPHQLRHHIAPLMFFTNLEKTCGWCEGAWGCARHTYATVHRSFYELKALRV